VDEDNGARSTGAQLGREHSPFEVGECRTGRFTIRDKDTSGVGTRVCARYVSTYLHYLDPKPGMSSRKSGRTNEEFQVIKPALSWKGTFDFQFSHRHLTTYTPKAVISIPFPTLMGGICAVDENAAFIKKACPEG
jgi:hypothetical protein